MIKSIPLILACFLLSGLLFFIGAFGVYVFITLTNKYEDPREILSITKTGMEFIVFPTIFLIVSLTISILSNEKYKWKIAALSLSPISGLIVLGLISDFRVEAISLFIFDILIVVLTFTTMAKIKRKKEYA